MNKSVLATILASAMLSLGKKKGGKSKSSLDSFLGTKDGKITIDFRTKYAFRREDDVDSPEFKVIRETIGNEIVEMLKRRESVYTSFGDGEGYDYSPPEYIESIEILREYTPDTHWPFGQNLTHDHLYLDAEERLENSITYEQKLECAERCGVDIEDVEDDPLEYLNIEPGYELLLDAWQSLEHDLGTCYLEVRFNIKVNDQTVRMPAEAFYNVCYELLYEYLNEALGGTSLTENDIIASSPDVLPVDSRFETDIRRF